MSDIVKSFDDEEIVSLYNAQVYGKLTYWKWGLGNDGCIYWQTSECGGGWNSICDLDWFAEWLTVARMKNIVQQFENLLPFL
jgi:hypothetical protein